MPTTPDTTRALDAVLFAAISAQAQIERLEPIHECTCDGDCGDDDDLYDDCLCDARDQTDEDRAEIARLTDERNRLAGYLRLHAPEHHRRYLVAVHGPFGASILSQHATH